MGKRNHSGRHRPSAVVICDRQMLLVQSRFHISGILDHTLIVAEYMSGFPFRYGDSKTSQLESQMFDRLQADFQGNKFRRKCTCLDCLLPFAVPHNRRSIEKDHVTSVGSASLLVRIMRCGRGSSASRYISEKSSFLV